MPYRKLWLGLALGVVISSAPAWAQAQTPQTTDQKIQQLQQEVDELQKEVKSDEAAVNGQDPGTATADYPNGFTIRSKDGNFVLHIGADLHRSCYRPTDHDVVVAQTGQRSCSIYQQPQFGAVRIDGVFAGRGKGLQDRLSRYRPRDRPRSRRGACRQTQYRNRDRNPVEHLS